MEKFDFENLSMTFFWGAKLIFGGNIFHENFWKKVKIFREKIRLFYFKNALFCSTKKCIFERFSERKTTSSRLELVFLY